VRRSLTVKAPTSPTLAAIRAHSYKLQWSLDDATWATVPGGLVVDEGEELDFDTSDAALRTADIYFRAVPMSSGPCAGTPGPSVLSEYD
jgi:hypothetical protein